MIRYELYSIDPLNQDDQRRLEGTYPLSLARKWAAACYADTNCRRVPMIRPVQIQLHRHCYFVQAHDRRWHIVADSPEQAARFASHRGFPASVWFCRDDFTAGCPPLLELSRAVW